MKRRNLRTSLLAATLAGCAAVLLPMWGVSAQEQETLYLIAYDQSLPAGYEADIQQAGGRVAAVSPELRAIAAVSGRDIFLPALTAAGPPLEAAGPMDAAPDACPGTDTGDVVKPHAPVSLSALDAEWSFQRDMERYAAAGGIGSPKETAEGEAGRGEADRGPPGEAAPLTPGTASGTASDRFFGAAGDLADAVRTSRSEVQLPPSAFCAAPGSAGRVLLQRALLHAAANGVSVTVMR
ncbi:hypothetical protein [Gorillibacterium sp. sgz5001074]|uniref:hypothetical protein n=1 Tax=Gorillibacterium sp. sgz5001074 TaxID=3446695 RepID=UPI003F672A01